MNRRDVLVGAGVIAAAGVARATGKTEEHHHDAPPAGGLLDATIDCEKRADFCLTHCLQMFATGDTSMVACAATVRDTIASAHALASLLAANSKHATAFAKLCADVCRDCEAECRKHAKHPVCKDCADACAKMIQEIAKLA